MNYASGTACTTWDSWNQYYYTTIATGTSTTAEYVWSAWNSYASSSTAYVAVDTGTSTCATVWARWNNSYWEIDNVNLGSVERAAPETAEQAAERAREHRERQAELARQAEEQNRLAQEAEQRAQELLTEHLTEEQRREFAKEKSFTVISKDGERRYRIRKGYSRNIERIDEHGKRLKTLCAHPAEQLPDYDHMLAQKLMLEHSEDDFLKIANVS